MRTYQFVTNRDAVRKIKSGLLIDISPSTHTTHYLMVPRVKHVKVSIYNGRVVIQFGKSWAMEMDEAEYERYEDDILAAALGEGA